MTAIDSIHITENLTYRLVTVPIATLIVNPNGGGGDDIAPANTSAPSISGLTQIGQILTANTGAWTGTPDPTFTYQWYADGVAIASEDSSTFTLTISQLNKTITVIVTAYNSVGQASALSAGVGPPVASFDPPDWWVTPAGAGNHSGSNLGNAGRFVDLDAIIAGAAPDDVIGLVGDLGNFSATSTSISHGGTSGHPITLRGIDSSGDALLCPIVGNRSSPWSMGGTTGPEQFKLVAGANNLIFEYLAFSRIGNGCIRIAADISNLTLRFCTVVNVQRCIEDTFSSPATSATVTGLTIQQCQALGFSRAFSRLRYNSNNVLMEDVVANSDFQDGDNFATAFVLDDTAHDVTYRRCTGKNVNDIILRVPTDYYNGDAFSTEGSNYNITCDTCIAERTTDGGYDFKSTNTLLTNCIARFCKRNYRIWGGATLLNCTGIDPHYPGGTGSHPTQVWVHNPIPSQLTINGCSFVDDHDEGDGIYVFDQEGSGSGPLVVTNTAVQTRGTVHHASNNPVSSIDIHNPPLNSVIPVASGIAQAGHLLTAIPGVWDQSITRQWQWKRNNISIDGETEQTYLLMDADVDQGIEVSAYATNVAGDVGEATSLPRFPISGVAPSNLSPPIVGGYPYVGQLLTATPGTWAGSPFPSFTYRWLADGVAIGGATSISFTLTGAQIGKVITVELSGTNSSGGPVVATSAPTAAVVASGVADFYVRRAAHGTGDGTSWANACAPSHVSSLSTTPDGHVYFRADEGDYGLQSMTIGRGGTPGHPVIFQGVDVNLTPMKATFVGTRNNWTLPVNPEQTTNISSWVLGGTLFSLTNCSYSIFSNFYFTRLEKPFSINRIITGLEFEDIECYNTREGFFIPTASLTIGLVNAAFRRIKATGFSKKFFRISSQSHDWTIDGVELNSGRQTGDNFATCIAGDDAAYNIVIDGTAFGFSGLLENVSDVESSTSYWNGDGISGESGNANWTVKNITGRGNTDAGLDTKGHPWLVQNCLFTDNKRNVRLWRPQVIFEDCVVSNPNKRGGSGGSANFFLIGVHSGWSAAADLLLRTSTVAALTPGSPAFSTDAGDTDIIARNVAGNTFTNTTSSTVQNDPDALVITGPNSATPPVITSPSSGTIYSNQDITIHLTADKGCSWAIVGGLDQSQYSITDSQGNPGQVGQFLNIGPQTYILDGYNDRVVQIKAQDANGNVTIFTYTTTIQAGAPPYTMQCLWEGPNNATTCTTEQGTTVTFVGGAKLSTSAPLEGTSSLLLGAANERCTIPDSLNWEFGGPFSLLALINLTATSGQQDIMAQYTNSTGNRGWEFMVNGSALTFAYTLDGSTVVNIITPTGVVTLGTHEVAIDRDNHNVLRFYVDGVMVYKVTVAGVLADVAQVLSFGNNGSFSRQFLGKMDNTRIWKNYFFCGSDGGYTP